MDDINYTKYSNKKPYNNLPVAEGLFLAPFLVRDWNEVKQMDYHRDNIETWHFSGIGVLVAFTPVTKEQFPVTMKLFWRDVHDHIASFGVRPMTFPTTKCWMTCILMMEPVMIRHRHLPWKTRHYWLS